MQNKVDSVIEATKSATKGQKTHWQAEYDFIPDDDSENKETETKTKPKTRKKGKILTVEEKREKQAGYQRTYMKKLTSQGK